MIECSHTYDPGLCVICSAEQRVLRDIQRDDPETYDEMRLTLAREIRRVYEGDPYAEATEENHDDGRPVLRRSCRRAGRGTTGA